MYLSICICNVQMENACSSEEEWRKNYFIVYNAYATPILMTEATARTHKPYALTKYEQSNARIYVKQAKYMKTRCYVTNMDNA